MECTLFGSTLGSLQLLPSGALLIHLLSNFPARKLPAVHPERSRSDPPARRWSGRPGRRWSGLPERWWSGLPERWCQRGTGRRFGRWRW